MVASQASRRAASAVMGPASRSTRPSPARSAGLRVRVRWGRSPPWRGPVGGVEVAAADLDQGVGAPLGRGAPVVGVEGSGFGEGADGGEHDLAGLGVQVAVEADHVRSRSVRCAGGGARKAASASLGLRRGRRGAASGREPGEHPCRQGAGLFDEQRLIAAEQLGGVVPGHPPAAAPGTPTVRRRRRPAWVWSMCCRARATAPGCGTRRAARRWRRSARRWGRRSPAPGAPHGGAPRR